MREGVAAACPEGMAALGRVKSILRERGAICRFLHAAHEMEHWTFWEWVAYSGLWIASIILAIDGGLRLYPPVADRLPRSVHAIVKSAWFAFAPLAFVIGSTVFLLLQQIVGTENTAAAALDIARLDVARVEPVAPDASRPDKGFYVNIYTISNGDFVVTGMLDNYRFEYPERLLTKEEEEGFMKMVIAGLPEPAPGGAEISPHQNGPWFSEHDRRITSSEWNDVLSGKKLAYVFIAMKYLISNHVKITESCIFLSSEFPIYNLCPNNNRAYVVR
jgi:hypothetical protein